jgi:3-oxoacyl-(acyl-carrier-protein) synthase
MQEKIVITGMGAICAVGHNVADTWENIKNGVSGLGPITLFDAEDFLVQAACEVKDFNPAEHIPARDARRRDRHQQFSAVAVAEALQQSGIEVNEENAGRIGVVISSAIGGISTLEESVISIDKGPAFSVASACASGQDGIGMAWMMLRAGMLDVAIAGACESTISPVGVAAFDRLQATSRRGPGEKTPSPFDKDRDGLIVGEGSAILILERESHAKARGAEILAELAGYAATADAFHITAPAEDGAGGSKAMRLALDIAGINFDEVDYINAHGTGTPLNDVSETLAIKSAFGEQAYSIPVSSTKSMTGHMMGATGALETIFCAHAVRENVLPPTINYQTPDPDCDLDYVPNEARAKDVKVAISNAFGFGGHNAVVAVREYA